MRFLSILIEPIECNDWTVLAFVMSPVYCKLLDGTLVSYGERSAEERHRR